MINIVMWLESNKYRNELSAVCAGNGIRIVEDKFNSSEDFLRTFSNLDTNIDVCVISNTNLENLNKKKFFEEVYMSEPNLRIVIVFPGYRNEYIEQQIADYKDMGITDVIYEGKHLDAMYFTEVIKKGYIYDYDINVYDEQQEDLKPLSQKPKCISIGVLGVTRGCGVTNMAINIANFISLSEDCNVKAVDFSGTGNLRFAKGKKVTYIVHSDIDVGRIRKTSRAVIFDFGTPYNISSKGKLISTRDSFDEEKLRLFKECDLKLLMCFSDVWHIGKIKYFLNDKNWRRELDSSYMLLFDTPPDKLKFPKIKVSGRNDKTVSETIRNLFMNQELIKK